MCFTVLSLVAFAAAGARSGHAHEQALLGRQGQRRHGDPREGDGGKNVLKLSADFKVPDTPDPHWQVVDSKGNVFLLQRLGIKGDKVNLQITLPAYVKDVAKVQIYCAWAEVVLGETTFDNAIATN